jgi:hypothetical protein
VPLGVFGFDLDDLVVDDLGLADLVEVLDVVDEAALVVEVVERLLLDGRRLRRRRRTPTRVADRSA